MWAQVPYQELLVGCQDCHVLMWCFQAVERILLESNIYSIGSFSSSLPFTAGVLFVQSLNVVRKSWLCKIWIWRDVVLVGSYIYGLYMFLHNLMHIFPEIEIEREREEKDMVLIISSKWLPRPLNWTLWPTWWDTGRSGAEINGNAWLTIWPCHDNLSQLSTFCTSCRGSGPGLGAAVAKRPRKSLPGLLSFLSARLPAFALSLVVWRKPNPRCGGASQEGSTCSRTCHIPIAPGKTVLGMLDRLDQISQEQFLFEEI